MSMPALAVVGADHQIVRSTESFRRKCEHAVALCERAGELDLVLTGQADAATVDLGEFSMAIEAVTDATGKRQAMLSLTAEELAADPEALVAALREAADESPAIVWVKDLDGCYLYVNPRYERDLETTAERLRGKKDADLPPVETVDGPRLRYIEDGLEEPLQLEYSVPAFESRPSMVAFRFPLREAGGQPVATCGVAAPSGESKVARDEAVRLMQLERWNRLDPLDVRAELLEQWHVQAKPGPVREIEPNGYRVNQRRSDATEDDPWKAADEVEPEAPDKAEPQQSEAPAAAPAAEGASYRREDEWVRQLRQAASIAAGDGLSETADALQCDLQLARKWAERADELQGELHHAHTRLHEAEAEAQQAASAAKLATDEVNRYRSELEQTRSELERLRQELEVANAEVQAARSEAQAARNELDASRAHAQSLRAPADAALRISEELGQALAAERERGDELARALARMRSRLEELHSAFGR